MASNFITHHPVLLFDAIDGDTVNAQLYLGLDLLTKQRPCRVYGIDAPELHVSVTAAAALKVRGLVSAWLASAQQLRAMLYDNHRDKYGRPMVDFYAEGKPLERLSGKLLTNKLAHPYAGDKKKSFTQAELDWILNFNAAL